MKEVMAIIRMNKINRTKNDLAAAGIPSIHAGECLGRGRGLGDFAAIPGDDKVIEIYKDALSYLGDRNRLVPKRILSIIVQDKLVGKVVETIMAANRTGNAGDGKIFVMPVSESIRIRTGEKGEDTLDEG